MQRKQRPIFRNIILLIFFSCLMLSGAQAAKPLWTFVPQTPTVITVAKGDNAQVVYTVQNHSTKAKNLVMKSITGISQDAACQLPAKGSCTVILNINGSALQGDVFGGPVLCQQGNSLQCFQPSASDILRIRLIEQPPVRQFTATPSAGVNGSISPATPQVINAGSSLTFTATPNTGFGVNEWLLDGNVVQTGGTSYQLDNIRANHSIEVTFNQTTLSPLTQSLALSINSPDADPALAGNPRLIRIQNTGSIPANNVQIDASGFPTGTLITNNTCTGTLNAGAICDITITPGGTASSDNSANACTTSPGTEPVPTIVTISADNAPSTNINVLLLGYGCIYQGGFLFSIDDSTLTTGSIGGKVAALTDEGTGPDNYQWSTVNNDTTANSLTDGAANTSDLQTPSGQYPAAQTCLNKNDQGFTDWYLPAICELGRYIGLGDDVGCDNTSANLYTTLRVNHLGNFNNVGYWSSTEDASMPSTTLSWMQAFSDGFLSFNIKGNGLSVRCIRASTL